MAPTTTTAVANGLLRQAVYYHLDNMAYENALFFAERLHAQDKSTEEAIYLLALCHLRLGDDRSAHEVSRVGGHNRWTHLGCAYVFAQACLRLELWKEGIAALEKSKGLWMNKNNMGRHSASSRLPYPDSAACSCLLGKLYAAHNDKKKAIACFEEALKTNPLMWDAFTTLCDMGVSVRVPNIFKVNDSVVRNFDLEANSAAAAQKEVQSNALEPLHVAKKTTARSAAQDSMDPFEQRSMAFQDIPSYSKLQSVESEEENNFMSKITAARSRVVTGGSSSHHIDDMETPTGRGVPAETHVSRFALGAEPQQAPFRRTRPAQGTDQGTLDAPPRLGYKLTSKRRDKTQELPESSSDPLPRSSSTTIERKRTVSGQPVTSKPMYADPEPGARRSARLNVSNKSTTKTSSGAANIGSTAGRELRKAKAPISRLMRPNSGSSAVGRVVSGNRARVEENPMDIDHAEAPTAKEHPAMQRLAPKALEPEIIRTEEALKSILDLLKKMGTGYQQLSKFQCQEALQMYNSLPEAHQNTPWVLAQSGRAQYEQASYAEAEIFFRRLRVMHKSRLQDMEVYSTILWFLKRETDLSFLAHELVDSSWHSPQAWCALGNAWSLSMDHEQALQCFKRATQLNPKFAYAYTLQGHEHVLNEEYDKAMTAYRQALSADRRHYNAYYGIGKVYEKLGNYDKAHSHYQAGSHIHPNNAVLICCIGTVLEKQKQTVQALQYFSKATELAPRAAQTRFKKARVLLVMGDLRAAQKELLILKDLAPDEARVHFLLGKLYKTLGDKSQAVRHFTTALSLDPKVSFSISRLRRALLTYISGKSAN